MLTCQSIRSLNMNIGILGFSIVSDLRQAPFPGPGLHEHRLARFGKRHFSFILPCTNARSVLFPFVKASYSWRNPFSGVNTPPSPLRQFIGNPEMGWKVAWSDRMVSMFTSMLLFGFVWRPLRRWIPKLPWWGFILFLLPMAIDGTSHLISDLAGIGQGFRDSNAWLAVITNQAFAPGFYAGDALGSFNSWMRLLTGISFGLGVVWFGFLIDEAFAQSRYPSEERTPGAKAEQIKR
jgi:uncharacterized membrane protein